MKRSISTNNVPYLAELRNENETLEDFEKIKCPEHYLLRWINYHLKNAGVDKKVKNFGSGLKVVFLSILLMKIYLVIMSRMEKL